MTTTNGSEWQEMLVLAGLTYRGGVVHGSLVGGAVGQGLADLAPGWSRVWGPSASHLLGDPLDACAMYVVQHRDERERYVVAVRGTNPLALSDWVFGDFDVGSTVAWPFASDGAALSKSTAFGLKWLLGLRWSAGSFFERAAEELAERWQLSPSLLAAVRRTKPLGELAAGGVLGPFERQIDAWLGNVPVGAAEAAFAGRLIGGGGDVAAADLRLLAERGTAVGTTLVEFLTAETRASGAPLDVVVTGHSKGGALAPALALWLHETRDVWDTTRTSTVRCCAFAGPTPGNARLAARIEQAFDRRLERVVNQNDIVTHAWALDDLSSIPTLYATRTAGFRGLIDAVCAALDAGKQDYRHPGEPAVSFAGTLDPKRLFGAEFAYQHMDAYLAHAGLAPTVDAIRLFLG